MDLHLKGKSAIVLGGTRGIGGAIVDLLAEEGAHVAFCARNTAQIAEAEAQLRARGAKVFGAVADIADHGALSQWIAAAAGQLGGIDILISNASGLAMGNAREAWAANFNVDMLGAVAAFDAAKPFLRDGAKAKGDAAAVFISSVSAAEADSGQAYGALKAALIHYAKGLARQYAKDRIRVNAVSPGTIYFKGGVWNTIETNMPEMYAQAMKRNPLGRMGTPQEIAVMAVMLASPVSTFTTGANVIVDGGITARVNF